MHSCRRRFRHHRSCITAFSRDELMHVNANVEYLCTDCTARNRLVAQNQKFYRARGCWAGTTRCCNSEYRSNRNYNMCMFPYKGSRTEALRGRVTQEQASEFLRVDTIEVSVATMDPYAIDCTGLHPGPPRSTALLEFRWLLQNLAITACHQLRVAFVHSILQGICCHL
jgi:hypothetical protein